MGNEWQQPDSAPVYAPHILKSLREIREVMGVGKETIREWVMLGAPIAVEGNGKKSRYSAEATRLQAWRERNAELCRQKTENREMRALLEKLSRKN